MQCVKEWRRDDLFVAVHETFWTDTCEYADIVLPADTQLERQDLVATYGNWYYVMNEPIIEPLGESVRNSELFRMLAKKMGYEDENDNAFTQTDEEIIRDISSARRSKPFDGRHYLRRSEKEWLGTC